MPKLCLALVLMLAAWSGYANAAPTLTATVDRSQISANETLTLKVRFEGAQTQSNPDFTSLMGQFDILSNQQSSQHSIINGKVSVASEWVLILAPKNTGQILIPPFQLQGQHSKPLSITVTSAATTSSSGAEDVFIETSVDKSEVFLNEQILLTFRLYYNQTVDSLEKPDLNIANTRVTELNRVDYQKVINQTRYGVAEYRYLLFPDTTGDLSIDAQTWTVNTTDQPNVGRFGFGMGRLKRYRPKTEALAVTVKPKPAGYPGNAVWLPAKDVKIEERWSREPSSMKVGEPITWSLTITAEGVNSEQLPPLLAGLQPSGFKIYPDQPSHETLTQASGVEATRTESVAIVPNQAGELHLPAVELSWWDTDEQKLKVAKLPARTVFVAGGAASASTAAGSNASAAAAAQNSTGVGGSNTAAATAVATATSSKQLPAWAMLLCALLVASNSLFVWLWWRARHQTLPVLQNQTGKSQAISDGKAFKQLQKACDGAPLPELRSLLITWAQLRWPNARPLSCAQIAQKCEDVQMRDKILALDQALFGSTGEEFDRAGFKAALNHLQEVKQSSASATSGLKPLYAA